MTMYEGNKILPDGWKIGGHQNFPMRSQWPKKSVCAVNKCAKIFTQKDEGMVEFGVGKVMVDVLRHWCRVSGITKYNPIDKSEDVTVFGDMIFGENGCDQYFEDIDTAWLLHYKICTNPKAWIWRWVFNYSDLTAFSIDYAVKKAENFLMSIAGKSVSATSSIKRDLECLISSYAFPSQSNRSLEDFADCPFRDLGLIQRTAINQTKIVRNKKRHLSIWLFAWAVIDFAEKKGLNHLKVDSIISDPESPGKIFCLDRESVLQKIFQLDELTDDQITISDSAGLQQMYINEDLYQTKDQYIKNIYEQKF